MKRFKIIIECVVTDKYYESDVMKMKNDILSGKAQRDLKRDELGVKKVTCTFEKIQWVTK